MIELQAQEMDLVYGGDHWGYEGKSEDWAALAARSYSYGSQGFWGSPYPSCVSTTEVQFRTVTTTASGAFSCSTSGSFPFFSCSSGPSQSTISTATTTQTVTCTH